MVSISPVLNVYIGQAYSMYLTNPISVYLDVYLGQKIMCIWPVLSVSVGGHCPSWVPPVGCVALSLWPRRTSGRAAVHSPAVCSTHIFTTALNLHANHWTVHILYIGWWQAFKHSLWWCRDCPLPRLKPCHWASISISTCSRNTAFRNPALIWLIRGPNSHG